MKAREARVDVIAVRAWVQSSLASVRRSPLDPSREALLYDDHRRLRPRPCQLLQPPRSSADIPEILGCESKLPVRRLREIESGLTTKEGESRKTLSHRTRDQSPDQIAGAICVGYLGEHRSRCQANSPSGSRGTPARPL